MGDGMSSPQEACHCGRPVTYGYDGNPDHHRGMCEHCDLARCDAHPQDCPYPTVADGLEVEVAELVAEDKRQQAEAVARKMVERGMTAWEWERGRLCSLPGPFRESLIQWAAEFLKWQAGYDPCPGCGVGPNDPCEEWCK